MKSADHYLMLNVIRNGRFSRDQLIDLWDAITNRICAFEEPELESAICEISDADETLKAALVEVEKRELRSATMDDCTAAKIAAEAEL